jgi:aerobic-type carbon monoxide dehydrogenase small subunit (CoxS/CutS family)
MGALELQVNGERHRVACDPATPLLYVLRNDLGLCAAKYGCGLEQCGACAVLVAGESTLSCRLPIARVAGREVITVEGLPGLWGDGADLHPVQRAFLAENAAQCAWCVPGILIATTALLSWNDDPDDAAIRRALAPHLCRCGAHPRILRAVRRAARELRA